MPNYKIQYTVRTKPIINKMYPSLNDGYEMETITAKIEAKDKDHLLEQMCGPDVEDFIILAIDGIEIEH